MLRYQSRIGGFFLGRAIQEKRRAGLEPMSQAYNYCLKTLLGSSLRFAQVPKLSVHICRPRWLQPGQQRPPEPCLQHPDTGARAELFGNLDVSLGIFRPPARWAPARASFITQQRWINAAANQPAAERTPSVRARIQPI